MSLSFVKKDGTRFFDGYEANYTTTCENGATNQSTGTSLPSSRVRDGHYKYVSGSPDSDNYSRIVGDLKRRGKAVGTFRFRVFVGAAYGICDTGTLEWVAFKQ